MKGFRVWNEREKTYDDGWDYLLSSDGGLYALKYGALVGMSGVDYLTVEFDTGLKDKNGKEIYEGDIVKGSWLYGKNWQVVKYQNYGFYPFIVTDFDGDSMVRSVDIAVIGNIHENQDLLGDTIVTNKEEE